MEREETAALAALGFLSPKEQRSAPAELKASMTQAAALLAESVPPAAPKPSVKGRLLDRVAGYEALKPLADVRPYDGGWVNSGVEGVDIRNLFRDPGSGRTTMLVRMEPGMRLPAHYHHDDEQCMVIRGDIRWGELVYQEGDFVVMGKETTHPEIHTVDGNLLLIVAGRNEFVNA
jgi:anti-sigma factor ChrR (cupin superfamily)